MFKDIINSHFVHFYKNLFNEDESQLVLEDVHFNGVILS